MASPVENRPSSRFLIGCVSLSAVIFFTSLIAGFFYYLHRKSAWEAEVKRREQQDIHTVRQIVIDVEAVCKNLGRAPKDQAELESLMGRPLPNVHDNGYPTPINYMQTGQNSFMLQYELWATDDWIYDSTKPDDGWVQHFY